MIPVLKGPKDEYYVIDHHHLAYALHEEGQKDILVNVIFDLSMLPRGEFWTVCDAKGWTHPYDKHGKRQDFSKIPKAIVDLEDDPYRSLAGELRRAGGYAKDTTPFSEFLWASFLRTRVKRNCTIGQRFWKLALQAEVIDDGPGVPAGISADFFYPLVTSRADGTGLGLSIAQSLIQSQHGMIEYERSEDRTIFRILLPLE